MPKRKTTEATAAAAAAMPSIPPELDRWLEAPPRGARRAFPATTLQTCVVHLIRNALDYAGWRDRRAVAQDTPGLWADRNAGISVV